MTSCSQKPNYESSSVGGPCFFHVSALWPKYWQCKFDWLMKMLINDCLCWTFLFKYSKITKVECSSSGKTCPNQRCNVVFVARNYSYMNVGCDLKKPLMKVKVIKDKLHGKICNMKFEFSFSFRLGKSCKLETSVIFLTSRTLMLVGVLIILTNFLY